MFCKCNNKSSLSLPIEIISIICYNLFGYTYYELYYLEKNSQEYSNQEESDPEKSDPKRSDPEESDPTQNYHRLLLKKYILDKKCKFAVKRWFDEDKRIHILHKTQEDDSEILAFINSHYASKIPKGGMFYHIRNDYLNY
jgi:hypothetical protein